MIWFGKKKKKKKKDLSLTQLWGSRLVPSGAHSADEESLGELEAYLCFPLPGWVLALTYNRCSRVLS